MKPIYCLMILLWPLVSTSQNVKPLRIGDKVPDITLTNVYNYPSSAIRLSDLKGKLVILDFWATWCGSCIHGFPKMDSLQKKFSNNLLIILVNNNGSTGNNEEEVIDFFRKMQLKTKGAFMLPSTTRQNPLLLQLFPHTFIPHYVWIGPGEKVIAITSSTEVTAENIEAVINRRRISLPVKADSLKFHPQN
jgi:thiol-disulfide isomerase/thioredoxin